MTEQEIKAFVTAVEDYLCAVANAPQYNWLRYLAEKQVREA